MAKILCAFLTVLLLVAGCGGGSAGDPPNGPSSGSLRLHVTRTEARAGLEVREDGLHLAVQSSTRLLRVDLYPGAAETPSRVAEFTLPEEGSARFAIPGLNPGPWKVVVHLRDEAGSDLASYRGAVEIVAGQVAELPVTLSPSPSPSPPGSRDFVYVANFVGGTVSGYELTVETGVLTPLPGFPQAIGAGPDFFALHPNGRWLYLSDFDAHQIHGFTPQPDGSLAPLPGSPYSGGGLSQPDTIAVHPSGEFLYSSNYTAPGVSGFAVDAATGALTPLAGSPFPTASGHEPYHVTVTGDGQFLYTANFGDDTMDGFAIGPSGGLSLVPGSPFATGDAPYPMIEDGADHLYVGSQVGDLVQVWDVQPDGSLVHQPSLDLVTDHPSWFALRPQDGVLFLVNGDVLDAISSFFRNPATGALTPTGAGPFPSMGDGPAIAALDPTGAVLVASNVFSDDTMSWTVGSGGTLTPAPGSPVPAGDEAYGVIVVHVP